MMQRKFTPEFEQDVRDYYRRLEEYDWTDAATRFVGPETFFHRARLGQVRQVIRRYGRPRFLDIGCGTGLVTRFLPPGTVGLDLNPRNLEKAGRYAPEARLVLANAEGEIPLASETFGTVVCTEMLEHLLYPERALREIKRVLRPGGRLIGSVPGRSLLWKLRGFSASKEHFTGEPYHKHYRGGEVRDLLASCFQVRFLRSRYWRMNWYFACEKRPA